MRRGGGLERETEDGGRFKAEGREGTETGSWCCSSLEITLHSSASSSPQSALPRTRPLIRLSAVPHSRPSLVALPGGSASCLGSFLSPPLSLFLSLEACQMRSLLVPFCLAYTLLCSVLAGQSNQRQTRGWMWSWRKNRRRRSRSGLELKL